ncbi:hypothetical protein [Streptomyces sp. NPDC055107]
MSPRTPRTPPPPSSRTPPSSARTCTRWPCWTRRSAATPRFSRYSFSTAWAPGTEAALIDNDSGDNFSALIAPAGVLVRGFDHESEMSPYATDDEQAWPGVIDEVPATLRPLLHDPAFVDEGLNSPRITARLYWETGGSAWRTGSGIEFPSGSPDPDGSGHLFRLLTDLSIEAVQRTSRRTTL